MRQIASGCILLAFAVALGAFGAHGLKNIVNESALKTFETGVRYQFYHGFAILCCGLLNLYTNSNRYNLPSLLFLIGIFLFSGSIYVLTFREYAESLKWAGPITPLGGLLFIAGWLIAGWKSLKPEKKA